MKHYKIIPEMMGGRLYYMIYYKLNFLFWSKWAFYERWNTPESAAIRLKELTK